MLEILKEDDKLLRKKCRRVSKVDDSIRNLCISMINTMISNEGIGLAANQIGVSKRIIVIVDANNDTVSMINPEIIQISNETIMKSEGCLSFPGQYYDIERPKEILVKFRDTKGHPRIEKYNELTARVIFHEIDHLDGITFHERM